MSTTDVQPELPLLVEDHGLKENGNGDVHDLKKTAAAAAATPESNSSATPEKKEKDPETKLCDFCFSEVPFKATRCRFCQCTLSKKSHESNIGFSVEREESEVSSEQGFRNKVSRIWILLQDERLKNVLQCYMNNDPRLFETEPKINAEELFTVLPALKRDGYGVEDHAGTATHSLITFLGEEYEVQKKKYEGMIAEKKISFEGLNYLFIRGLKVFGNVNGFKVGTEVLETSYVRTMVSTVFMISGEVIKSNGENFYNETCEFIIPQFKGSKDFSELPVQPLDDESFQYLKKRGKSFAQFAKGSHYIHYKGKMLYKTTFYTTHWRADGRAMVDCSSFNKMNADYKEFNQLGAASGFSHHHGGRSTMTDRGNLSDDNLYKTWPSVGGFSFTAKKWGELFIDDVHPVVFDEAAFDRLVLPAEKKSMVRALVENSGDTSFSDVITGKGGGCIFLLHGPPGCGKTLTAEAIAELLHRPLYSVGVGELGTTSERLEKVLKDLLDVASVWNAVVLIDEADIFLAKRVGEDVTRNAMVGIFLRMLEYHQGILFLTTNRVDSFDEAFHSRISVSLRYEELDQEARSLVWQTFLSMANINHSSIKKNHVKIVKDVKENDEDDVNGNKSEMWYDGSGISLTQLASYKLNGRQIRNVIRLATSLAKSEHQSKISSSSTSLSSSSSISSDVKLQMDHFHRSVSVVLGQVGELSGGDDHFNSTTSPSASSQQQTSHQNNTFKTQMSININGGQLMGCMLLASAAYFIGKRLSY